jgi:hypothetical protein
MHLLEDGQFRESRFIGGDLSRSVVATAPAAGGSAAIFWRDLGGAIERQSLAEEANKPRNRLGGNAVWRLLGRPGQPA